MSTYSISQGVTYAEKLENFQALLNVLPDNTQKIISPRDVRDSFFTTWENIVYKTTKISTSDIQYIGIDKDDLTEKVYFGKKKLGGQEVMTETLLNNDVDYYFYNNKVEPQDNYDTKIAFLGGTGSFYYEGVFAVPYIESKLVTVGAGNYLNFEIRNTSYITDGADKYGGDINILSDKGYVSINGVIFPKYVDNAVDTNDGKYLKFVWDGVSAGYATWSTVEIPNMPDPVDPTVIYFTDATPTPQALGGIPAGETFDNVPVTEMFRKLLYPYLKPSVTSDFAYGVIESGDTTTAALQRLNYTIKRPGTYSITGVTIDPPNLQTGSPALISPGSIPQTSTGVSAYVVPTFNIYLPSTSANTQISTTMTISDSYAPPTTLDDGASFRIVLPWYYGVSTTAISTVSGINSILGKTTNPAESDKLVPLLKTSASSTIVTLTTVGLGGQGCIYFGYPSSYADITSIKDQNDFDITGDFTKFTLSGIVSPWGRWGGGSENREYKFFIFTQGTGTPKKTTLSGAFQFKFNF